MIDLQNANTHIMILSTIAFRLNIIPSCVHLCLWSMNYRFSTVRKRWLVSPALSIVVLYGMPFWSDVIARIDYSTFQYMAPPLHWRGSYRTDIFVLLITTLW